MHTHTHSVIQTYKCLTYTPHYTYTFTNTLYTGPDTLTNTHTHTHTHTQCVTTCSTAYLAALLSCPHRHCSATDLRTVLVGLMDIPALIAMSSAPRQRSAQLIGSTSASTAPMHLRQDQRRDGRRRCVCVCV